MARAAGAIPVARAVTARSCDDASLPLVQTLAPACSKDATSPSFCAPSSWPGNADANADARGACGHHKRTPISCSMARWRAPSCNGAAAPTVSASGARRLATAGSFMPLPPCGRMPCASHRAMACLAGAGWRPAALCGSRHDGDCLKTLALPATLPATLPAPCRLHPACPMPHMPYAPATCATPCMAPSPLPRIPAWYVPQDCPPSAWRVDGLCNNGGFATHGMTFAFAFGLHSLLHISLLSGSLNRPSGCAHQALLLKAAAISPGFLHTCTTRVLQLATPDGGCVFRHPARCTRFRQTLCALCAQPHCCGLYWRSAGSDDPQ